MNPPDIVTPLRSQALSHRSLIEAFERQALLNPHRTAVISGNERLTFHELSDRANTLARQLVRLGACKGSYLGVGISRSVELIIALLGILKTGAAYIPVDPTYPAARIRHMIESSGIDLVVTTSARAVSFPFARTLPVDQLATEHRAIFQSESTAGDDPIYAIFTSGSTGLAKAATVFHRGFANLLDWYVNELDLTSTDTTLVISSPSFDLTQKNFFAPLITGGTLVLDSGETYDIHRIASLIRDHRVTLINCTPSAFYPLIDAAAGSGFADLASLRFAVLGGEPISIPRLRTWLTHASCQAETVNSYGPTECTDICAFHRLGRGNLDAYPFVPTGSEIPNVTVTIRDENLQVLPTGEPGELCIEGIGVGGGYLNDPARTAEHFVNGIYRTGDLARRLPTGVIEFRGRADHQVKINGFRIELGEIEAAIQSHPDVLEAVVTAADGRLIAHVQGSATSAILRDHLAAQLPAYMIPGEFEALDRFPLTPNGKIDRAALGRAAVPVASVSLTGGTSLESELLALWSEILGRPVIDPAANFFDLGGTSIHLAVVHVRLRAITGSDLSITDLFAHPSARSLALHLAPPAGSPPASQALERARLQQAGLSRFRRPIPR